MTRRAALTRFCEDVRLEPDTIAPRTACGDRVRSPQLDFRRLDKSGERTAAAMYTLIETAKLNVVDPEAWLRDVLTRVGDGHPVNRVADLIPWALSLAPQSR